jgi:hypothetical protein
MMDERIWHYVRANETTRIPRRHIFLDTESVAVRTKHGHRQRWRLGVAIFRVADKGRRAHDETRTYRDSRSLWADVSAFAKPRSRTILWAHNVGFDVRIADAFRALPALGWRLEAHNLANRGTWLSWRRGDSTLLMVDSTSVFPVPLATLAKSFLRAKLPLPADGDPWDAWMARCVRDAELLRDSVVAYLDWLDEADLGNWQMTGAGQSYAAFRHRHLTHKMLVHADPHALALEREAMWTGRCEAYWRGRTRHVGLEEWDLELAYGRLARDNEVPTQIIGPVDSSTPLRALLGRPHQTIVARVEVETDQPVAPARIDGRILWPVGKFETVLWAPELELALASGARVRATEIVRYHTAPALKQWAEWIIDALRIDNPNTLAWQRIVLKHWVRALIGRFGMSYTKWSRMGTTANHDVRFTTVYDTTTQETYDLTHLGDAVMRADGVVDWAQSQPAITGYIMSLARVWLWKLCQAMPPQSVLYADTDSFYTTRNYHAAAAALAATPLGEGLRLKSTYTRAEILGPRQVITDGRARISGIPRAATLLPGHQLTGEVWDSLEVSLRRGDTSAVTTTDRRWKVSGVDRRRAAGPDGWTQPITVGRG